MTPIKFPEHNVVFAEDQPEYQPLPVYKDESGTVISCWHLTWRERFKVFFHGRFWLSQMTFNGPLQPQLPMVDTPFEKL